MHIGNINPFKMNNMKFIDIIFQKFRFVCILFLCMLCSGIVNAKEGTDKKEKNNAISVNLVVVDPAGSPVSNAQVVVGEGIIHTETDAQGVTYFRAFLSDMITITSKGYEKEVTTVDQILKNKTIQLRKAKLFMTSDDNVPLPFMTLKKRFVTGSESVLGGDKLDKYPSTDLRNALTGQMTGLEVLEKYGTPGMDAEEKSGNFGAMEKISLQMRGRSPIWIIDDVPTDITEMPLDPQEVESVTLLKDVVAKAMFGPQAADGAIFVKTKRGIKNDHILNVNVESGVSSIDRMPEFVSGANYARLNNLAKINSGLAPLYTDDDIAAYAKNDPYDMYHPSINFRNYMLKNTKSFQKVNLSSRGGTENVQYFANLAYDGDGDIYKIGPSAATNRLTTRENIDVKVNDVITTQLNFYGGLNLRQSPNYGYDSNYGADNSDDGTMDIVEMDRVLDDITSISPIAFPVYAKNDSTVDKPWYAISHNFGNNPIGRLTQEGSYTQTTRTGNIALTFNYDMKNIIKGLTSKTFINYQTLNTVRIGKAKDYMAYYVTPDTTATGQDTIDLTYARSSVDMAGQAKLHDYYYHRFASYESLNFDRTFGPHAIQSTATFFISKSVYNGIEEPRRLLSGIWSGNYTYNDKYSIQGVVNYSGTSSFSKSKRSKAFPSVGLAWVVSEENFMSNLKFINYLKLHADAGKLGYESFTSPYLYNTVYSYNTSGSKFGPAPTGYWFGSSEDKTYYQTYPSRTGNPNLTWETRKEYSVGMDASLFNNTLSLEVNYYNNTREGIITQLSNVLAYVAGASGAKPYSNYNSTRYYGYEFNLQYSNKIGQLYYSFGGNAQVRNSKILKLDEPKYRFSYQSRVGKPEDRFFGLKYLGQFQSDDEALVVPQLYDATLHAGDFKYQDMNNDGVVDDNDQTMIGHTTPKLAYALNLKLSYKGFELTVIGAGRADYDIALNNKYYWNGWGDNNYSKFVLDHNGGTYPKLTYLKVNNNYQDSQFWLTSGNYFKIKNVEVAYTIPAKQAYALHTKGIRIFVHGANLLTVSKIKDVDPENINSGIDSYPLFKTFTGGIKLTF